MANDIIVECWNLGHHRNWASFSAHVGRLATSKSQCCCFNAMGKWSKGTTPGKRGSRVVNGSWSWSLVPKSPSPAYSFSTRERGLSSRRQIFFLCHQSLCTMCKRFYPDLEGSCCRCGSGIQDIPIPLEHPLTIHQSDCKRKTAKVGACPKRNQNTCRCVHVTPRFCARHFSSSFRPYHRFFHHAI